MAQTQFSFYAHLIFSTKNRLNLIPNEIEDGLYSYIRGIIKNQKCLLLDGNGTANHIHLLVSLDKNVLVPELVGKVKRDSTKWIKQQHPKYSKFQWQEGYLLSRLDILKSKLSVNTSAIKNYITPKLFLKMRLDSFLINMPWIIKRNIYGIS